VFYGNQCNYYLGNWHLSSDGTYTIGGAKFLYKRSYIEPEVLRSDGPLLEDLVLEVNIMDASTSSVYRTCMPPLQVSIGHGCLHFKCP
jgi:hypothetical protein